MIGGSASLPRATRTHRMKPTEAGTLPKTLGTFPLPGRFDGCAPYQTPG